MMVGKCDIIGVCIAVLHMRLSVRLLIEKIVDIDITVIDKIHPPGRGALDQDYEEYGPLKREHTY